MLHYRLLADEAENTAGLSGFLIGFIYNFLEHLSQQSFCGEAAGVTGHDLRAGAACRTGVGGVLGVVHDELDVGGLEAGSEEIQ